MSCSLRKTLPFFFTFQKLSISKLEIQEVLFATKNELESCSFFSKIKSLAKEEVKVKPVPLTSCISAASLGGLDTELMHRQ